MSSLGRHNIRLSQNRQKQYSVPGGGIFDKCRTPFPDGFLGCLASSSSFGFARKLAAGFICKMRRGGLIRPADSESSFHFISFHFCLLSPTALLSFLHSHSKTIAAPIRLTPRSSGTGRLTGAAMGRPAFQFPLLSLLWIGWNPRGDLSLLSTTR